MGGSMKQTSVFLADGHAMFRAGLRLILEEQSDLTVVGEAGDGFTAVDEVARLTPDVLVTDIWLPRMSGIAATARIHKSHPRVRIVILAMNEDMRLVEDGLRAGASGYVSKTSSGAELVAAIQAVRDGRSYLTPAVGEALVDRLIHPGKPGSGQHTALTDRESEVLRHLAEGRSAKEIAGLLQISERTAETHRANLMRKLDVKRAACLVRIAIRDGLIAP